MYSIQRPSISFEFFPPKTSEGVEQLSQVAKTLEEQQPSFFSVTYGAGGSTRQGTLSTVQMLRQQARTNIAPHLACIGSSRTEIIEVIKEYQQSGLHRIVALRGDLPSGMGQAGEFKYASELVALIREITGNHFHIEVAAYPEIHPQAFSPEQDIISLQKKCIAGADSAITQYFYNPDAYFYYVDACRRQGITIPIIPGIMPITQFARLARFSEMCGAEIPAWIRKRLQAYGDDLEAIGKFGVEVVYKLCQTLLAGGAPGLHFYTLNKVTAVQQVLVELNLSYVTPLAAKSSSSA